MRRKYVRFCFCLFRSVYKRGLFIFFVLSLLLVPLLYLSNPRLLFIIIENLKFGGDRGSGLNEQYNQKQMLMPFRPVFYDRKKEFLSNREFYSQNFELKESTIPICSDIPPGLEGNIKIEMNAVSLKEIEKKHPDVSSGGRWHPSDCISKHKIAMIIPFRDRFRHLKLFLNHMIPFLKKQQLDFRIYIVETADKKPFNRGLTKNIGFLEAQKDDDYTCYIFHDIDILPEDDRIMYVCEDTPLHFSVAIDSLKYRLPYKQLVGGAIALKKEHMEKLNGYSNMFWGWGGEDDDMYNRMWYNHYKIARYPAQIAKYIMLKHKKDVGNPERCQLLRSWKKRLHTDGLNSVEYKVLEKQLNPLYTWVHAEVTNSDNLSPTTLTNELNSSLIYQHLIYERNNPIVLYINDNKMYKHNTNVNEILGDIAYSVFNGLPMPISGCNE